MPYRLFVLAAYYGPQLRYIVRHPLVAIVIMTGGKQEVRSQSQKSDKDRVRRRSGWMDGWFNRNKGNHCSFSIWNC